MSAITTETLTATPTAAQAQPPALDLATALRRLGGNDGLLDRLATRFVQTEADATQRIAAALSAGDRDAAVRAAHTLKGLSASLCADRLSTRAAAIEAALLSAQGGDVAASLRDPLAELDVALQEALAQLRTRAPSPAGANPGAATERPTAAAPPGRDAAAVQADRDALAADLRRLAALIADADLDATRGLDAVIARVAAAGEAARGRRLDRLLQDYDFDAAMPLLEELARAVGVDLS